MIESGYYPLGAEFDTSAPYNQKESEPIEKDVQVMHIIHKKLTLKLDSDDVTQKDLKEAYADQQLSVMDIINWSREYAYMEAMKSGKDSDKGKYMMSIFNACEGWTEEDVEFDEA